MTEKRFKSIQCIAGLFFLALALVGLGHAALLPPFEGADETAHYSRIKAMAFPPADGNADMRMAEEVDAYTLYGPMSPGWIGGEVGVRKSAPFANIHDGLAFYTTYDRFFSDPDMQARYDTLFRRVPVAPVFLPSFRPNWQYQHPASYYALMAPVLRGAEKLSGGGLPLAQTVFVLRVANLALALLGIGIGLAATFFHFRRFPPENASLAALLAAATFYPFWMPTFFAQVGRMGNDSLCYVAVGLVWAALLWLLRNPRDKSVAAVLGLTLGLATMVKMTLFPLIIAAIVFLTGFYARDLRRGGLCRLGAFAPVFITGGLAGFIYLALWGENILSGTSPVGNIVEQKDVWAQLGTVVWRDALMAALDTAMTSVYYFLNWLFVRPPLLYAALFSAVPALLTVFYAGGLWRWRTFFSDKGASFWFLGAFMGGAMAYGFFYAQLWLRIEQLIPGYYVHAYAAFLGVMCGLGAAGVLRAFGRTVLSLAMLGGLIGTGRFVWEQALFYTGCLVRIYPAEEGATGVTALNLGPLPAAEYAVCKAPAVLLARLDVVAWPAVFIPCFVLAVAAALVGIVRLWQVLGAEGGAQGLFFTWCRQRFGRKICGKP